MWILVATKYSIALKRATGLANFIWDNIFYRFEIPKRIISNYGTPLINSHVREFCEQYGVDNVKSSPYYPQGNGQVEATNKTPLRILSWMVYEEPKRWAFISLVLWSYRTLKHISTQAIPFSLIYGAEVVVPVEIMVPSARLALASKLRFIRLSQWRGGYQGEKVECCRQIVDLSKKN